MKSINLLLVSLAFFSIAFGDLSFDEVVHIKGKEMSSMDVLDQVQVQTGAKFITSLKDGYGHRQD